MKKEFRERDLAPLARRFRKASGKNRGEAARELDLARPTVHQAEENPELSLFKVRKRIIEKYSPYKVVGPFFRLEEK